MYPRAYKNLLLLYECTNYSTIREYMGERQYTQPSSPRSHCSDTLQAGQHKNRKPACREQAIWTSKPLNSVRHFCAGNYFTREGTSYYLTYHITYYCWCAHSNKYPEDRGRFVVGSFILLPLAVDLDANSSSSALVILYVLQNMGKVKTCDAPASLGNRAMIQAHSESFCLRIVHETIFTAPTPQHASYTTVVLAHKIWHHTRFSPKNTPSLLKPVESLLLWVRMWSTMFSRRHTKKLVAAVVIKVCI